MQNKIAVLGAGSWGTALAILAGRNNHNTLLWGHNAKHIAQLNKAGENTRYLPDARFPKTLRVTSEISEVAAFSHLILIAVPSHAFKDTLIQLKPFLPKNIKIAWATKGFNTENSEFLHETIQNTIHPNIPSAVISGPTFAMEVASDLPTAVTVASTDAQFADELTTILSNPRFRVYTSSDVIGVETGGAVKNVLAIAAGIADGLGFGANTRAALITRGLTEIQRLGLALGGKQDTFMGLAGLGDLILTCTDNQSRNRRFGLAIGQGKSQDSARKEINQEIEGIVTTRNTYLLAKKLHIDMPITEQIYKVLYEHLDPIIAVKNLLNREQKSETST